MSRDGADLPIWARPEPRTRQPRFSRERIAAVALEIADAEGFAALSMRHVAARLGTGAMTLYNYVRTKDELVALMHDALLAETLRPADTPAADWPDVLADIAHRTRAMLVRHPWAVLSLGAAQFGPNALRHVEQSLAALDQAGLAPSAALELLALVNDYVRGNVLRAEQARRQLDAARADPERVRVLAEFGVAQLRSGDYPLLARLMADRDPAHLVDDGAGPPLDPAGLAAEFDRGLHALLTGAAHRLGLPTPAHKTPLPHENPLPHQGPTTHKGPIANKNPNAHKGPTDCKGAITHESATTHEGPATHESPAAQENPARHENTVAGHEESCPANEGEASVSRSRYQ